MAPDNVGGEACTAQRGFLRQRLQNKQDEHNCVKGREA
jgi:hypothetical protein